MDALELLREHKRMCNCYEACCDCPLEASICPGSSTMPDEDYKKLITVVEHWSKEHPRKTRQSVFLEQYPEAKIDGGGCLELCPCTISTTHRDEYGRCAVVDTKCFVCRREFWQKVVG